MSRYEFRISNGHPYRDPGEELPDDQAAWSEALATVRDVETSLNLDTSNSWSIEVLREGTPIFWIDVTAKRLTPS